MLMTEVPLNELVAGEKYFIYYGGIMEMDDTTHMITGNFVDMRRKWGEVNTILRPAFNTLSVFPGHPEVIYPYEIEHGWRIYHTEESGMRATRRAMEKAEARMFFKDPALGISLKQEILMTVWDPVRALRTGLLQIAYDEIDAEFAH